MALEAVRDTEEVSMVVQDIMEEVQATEGVDSGEEDMEVMDTDTVRSRK